MLAAAPVEILVEVEVAEEEILVEVAEETSVVEAEEETSVVGAEGISNLSNNNQGTPAKECPDCCCLDQAIYRVFIAPKVASQFGGAPVCEPTLQLEGEQSHV